MDIKDIFAKNLSELRQTFGLTQVELGDRLNYSDKTISKWERGESIPDAGVLKQVADVFGVSVDYLLQEDHAAGDSTLQGTPAVEEPKTVSDALHTKHLTIVKLVQTAVWLLSLFVMVVVWIFTRKFYWLIAIWTLPVSFLLAIIFTSLWSRHKGRNNFIFISLFILSILLAVYLSTLSYNLWLLFVLMAPVELLLYFCFKLYFAKIKRASETS